MKIIGLLLLILFTGETLFVQKVTTIDGYVKHGRTRVVNLYDVVNGEVKVLKSTEADADGKFRLDFSPKASGFYTVGDDRRNYVVYVKGGEKIHVDLFEKEGVLGGKNTRENKALYQWENHVRDLRMMSGKRGDYKDFFSYLTKFVAQMDSVKRAIKSGNPVFDELLYKKMDYDVDYCAMVFLMSWKRPPRTDRPAYYDTILADEKFTSDELLLLPGGLNTLVVYYNYTYEADKPIKGEAFFTNTRLRGELLLYLFSIRAKYTSDYEEFISENSKILTEEQKERAKVVAAKLHPSFVGRKGDFTYPDVSGKDVSLSDFEGKVVVVDVWTTTCGACFAQHVYLSKLEEEMQNKDVVFIGISLDKDQQKWKDVVKEKGLDGIQLYASDKSQFAKDYNITGVPRFIVFDKKGCVVKEEAPRPSDSRLKEMIEAELKK